MQHAHENGDAEREAQLDVELHTLVVEAAHNLVFLHVLRACYRLLADDVFDNRKRLYGQPGERKTLLDQHLALIKAITPATPRPRDAPRRRISTMSALPANISPRQTRAKKHRKLRRTIRLANAG
jgi:DNA-binding FadR family transcriptional regulator